MEALDHCPDERPGGEVLTGSAFGILGILLQKPFLDLFICIYTHHDPVFFVDHINDLVQHCSIVGHVLGFCRKYPGKER